LWQILERVHAAHGEVDVAISVVSIVELTHGIYRAKSDQDRQRRKDFGQEIQRSMVVLPLTTAIAELAGRIEGEQAVRGISIAFEDLLIGVTALHLGFEVLTLNVRHFQRIPGLGVLQL
jgi:tRNA(fMet)-specific endonuclease VapC